MRKNETKARRNKNVTKLLNADDSWRYYIALIYLGVIYAPSYFTRVVNETCTYSKAVLLELGRHWIYLFIETLAILGVFLFLPVSGEDLFFIGSALFTGLVAVVVISFVSNCYPRKAYVHAIAFLMLITIAVILFALNSSVIYPAFVAVLMIFLFVQLVNLVSVFIHANVRRAYSA